MFVTTQYAILSTTYVIIIHPYHNMRFAHRKDCDLHDKTLQYVILTTQHVTLTTTWMMIATTHTVTITGYIVLTAKSVISQFYR